MLDQLQPWEFADNVMAACTSRMGGYSQAPYAELNLGYHVGDQSERVRLNRQALRTQLALPTEPHWLNQIHGSEILEVSKVTQEAVPKADGSYTKRVNEVLAIQVADCLPILISSLDGSEIMALHAGWRSLQAGIVQRGLSRFGSHHLRAWIGPGIRQCHFEVGLELQEAFPRTYFSPGRDDEHLYLDLAGYATGLLRKAGVADVIDSQVCTVCCNDSYFSHRLEGPTGRFAALLWKVG